MIREQRGLLDLVVRDGALNNYCRTGDSFIVVYEYRMKQAARNVCVNAPIQIAMPTWSTRCHIY